MCNEKCSSCRIARVCSDSKAKTAKTRMIPGLIEDATLTNSQRWDRQEKHKTCMEEIGDSAERSSKAALDMKKAEMKEKYGLDDEELMELAGRMDGSGPPWSRKFRGRFVAS